MLYIFLLLAVFTLAYANGANDNFKACATVFGSRTVSYKKALAWATIAQICGSGASLLLARALMKAFSGKGLVPDALITEPAFLLAVATGATVAILMATRMGLPISTTHALIGGLIGAGFAFAPSGVVWNALGVKYFLPLLLSPLLAMCATAILYPLARGIRIRLGVTAQSCMCLDTPEKEIVINPDSTISVAQSQSPAMSLCLQPQEIERYEGSIIGISAQKIADTLHLGSAFSLGFSRGLNDTPKILGLLVPAAIAGINMNVALCIVAIMMALGGIIHSRRIAQTMGENITPMNTGQGLLANMVSSLLVLGASLMGHPVSTTHVTTGSIFGIGAWTGKTDWRLVSGIVLAWVVTLPLAGILAYLIALGFKA